MTVRYHAVCREDKRKRIVVIAASDHGKIGISENARDRDRLAFDARQIGHVIVERLELAGVSVAEHLFEPAFRLAGEEGDAERPPQPDGDVRLLSRSRGRRR